MVIKWELPVIGNTTCQFQCTVHAFSFTYLPSRYLGLWRVHGRLTSKYMHTLSPNWTGLPLNFCNSTRTCLCLQVSVCWLRALEQTGMVWLGWWNGLWKGANGCRPATGPRDPPDRSKLALHRRKQKLYATVKELELSNSIGCLE